MNPTAHALSVQHHPNESIFFEDISVTHINGKLLPEPFQSHGKLHLFPRISFRIKSERLPRSLISLQQECFRITTLEGCDTKVYLRYNINEFMRSGDYFKGYLIPAELPCSVIGPDVEVKRTRFGILNFQGFYGRNDKWIYEDGNSRRLGSTQTNIANFRMEITECHNFLGNKKFLSRNDGYSVTHVGLVERIDGDSFLTKDVRSVLRATRAFLSFARGSACGLTYIKATMPDGEEKFLEWGSTYAEPWICGSESWLPTTEGGDILSQLFPRFYDLCCDPNWHDTVFAVTDWYLNSNESPFHIGIILTQAALEALSYKMLKREVKPKHKQIRNALSSIGIDEQIPASCKELGRWVNSVHRSKARSHGGGPEAITQMRNDLVHADKRYGRIPAEAQIDALRLSQWYIEMILLNKVGYAGRYRNRVSKSGRSSVEDVPWKA